MKKYYEKPQMNVEDFCTNSAVADTCWGLKENHPHQKTRYYDVKGNGIVSFNVVGSGNCSSPDAYNIVHIYNDPETGRVVTGDGSSFEGELEKALATKGGSDGQPYSGLNADFPTDIIPDSK